MRGSSGSGDAAPRYCSPRYSRGVWVVVPRIYVLSQRGVAASVLLRCWSLPAWLLTLAVALCD